MIDKKNGGVRVVQSASLCIIYHLSIYPEDQDQNVPLKSCRLYWCITGHTQCLITCGSLLHCVHQYRKCLKSDYFHPNPVQTSLNFILFLIFVFFQTLSLLSGCLWLVSSRMAYNTSKNICQHYIIPRSYVTRHYYNHHYIYNSWT